MTRKRKKGEIEASHLIEKATLGIQQLDMAFKLRQEVELQLAFLQAGFRPRPSAPWPSTKK